MPTDRIVRKLMPLDSRARAREINKMRLPFERADALNTHIKDQKREIRSLRARERVFIHRWRTLINTVKLEIDNTRRLLLHHTTQATQSPRPSTPARIAALEAYLAVLNEVIFRMSQARSQPDMPLPSAFKGDHWPDWVPERIKHRVRVLFDAIPHEPRAKRKEPFIHKTRGQRVPESTLVPVPAPQPTNPTEEGESK